LRKSVFGCILGSFSQSDLVTLLARACTHETDEKIERGESELATSKTIASTHFGHFLRPKCFPLLADNFSIRAVPQNVTNASRQKTGNFEEQSSGTLLRHPTSTQKQPPG
jgi:hypothetical protein